VREGDELALWEGELRILVPGETVLLLASRERNSAYCRWSSAVNSLFFFFL
jgi:hypothetical protein